MIRDPAGSAGDANRPAAGARRARLAVLASGEGSNLQALLDASAQGRLAADIAVVACNRPGARALERAAAAGVATLSVPLKPFLAAAEAARPAAGGDAARSAYDDWLGAQVAAYQPDFVVLAGWMLVLGPRFLDRFPGRVLNLHPALPGAFPGKDAIARAWNAGRAGACAETGVMVHVVVPEVDAGPVVAVERVPLLPGEPLADLEARMHAVEHGLLVAAVQRVLAEAAREVW